MGGCGNRGRGGRQLPRMIRNLVEYARRVMGALSSLTTISESVVVEKVQLAKGMDLFVVP